MTQLATPPQWEGRQVCAGLWISAACLWSEGQPDQGSPPWGLVPSPSSRAGAETRGSFTAGGSSLSGARPASRPLPSPILEQPWDFLPRGRPRLIHPGGFWGDIPAVGRPPSRRPVGGGSSQLGAPGFCPENWSLGSRGGWRKGVCSLVWALLFFPLKHLGSL